MVGHSSDNLLLSATVTPDLLHEKNRNIFTVSGRYGLELNSLGDGYASKRGGNFIAGDIANIDLEADRSTGWESVSVPRLGYRPAV